MAVARGGHIKQAINEDHYLPDSWQPDHTLAFNVQLINSEVFQQVTGQPPPRTPVTAKAYAEAGLPFFDIHEQPSHIHGDFKNVKSIAEIDNEDEPTVKPDVIMLDSRRRRATPAYEELKKIVDDPDGLLDPVGPLREFRTVKDLKDGLDSMTLNSFEENMEVQET